MMTYIFSLIGLPLLCVLWIVFQGWLAKQDPKYKGYQAGCGGCSRSCGDNEISSTKSHKQDSSCDDDCKEKIEKVQKMHFIDASDLWSKHQDMK